MANPRPLIQASNAFLDQLDIAGDAAVREMLRRYGPIMRALLDALAQLTQQLKGLESPTPAQLYRLDRYQNLLRMVDAEMTRMGATVADRMPGLVDNASGIGLASARELALLQSNAPGVAGAFNRLSAADVSVASSYVAPNSPLMNMLLTQYGNGWANVIASQYVSGVALGQSPLKIVAGLKQTLGTAMPADITRIIRTAQLWSYRQTNREAWQKSGVVDEWVWHATLDATTCASCWAQNGTRHPVTEVLDDHHNGRCAMVPVVSSNADYQADPVNIPTGEEVFNRYPAARQKEIADAGGWGPQYRAYKDGAIKFSDMTRTQNDAVYGDMKSAASLKALLGQDAAQYYA